MHIATTSLKWAEMVVAADQTHHLIAGAPAYLSRFLSVDKFRPPGLAVARDENGMFHITPDGIAAYAGRFIRVFGFYEGCAATQTKDGWLHILPDGTQTYDARYDWVGNWQESRCVVRDFRGKYFHIKPGGVVAYAERYAYAGDFREDAAVVQREDGLATHIGREGQLLHGRWLLGLDVFHKGYARARDEKGWHHITRSGQEAYGARFQEVDSFYNGQAWAKCGDGEAVTINTLGDVVRKIG